MENLKTVFQFGAAYLRPYWGRFVAGLILGALFGLANASFVWATRTLIARFDPPPAVVAGGAAATKRPQPAAVPVAASMKERLRELGQAVDRKLDPWLPKMGSAMTWQRVLGALLFLPFLVLLRSGTDYLSNYCMGWVSERVINDMRLDVLEKLSTLSLDFFNRSTTGDLLTRINSDTSRLLRCLKTGAGDLIKETISLGGIVMALVWIDWKLTLFAVVFLPLCLFPLIVLGKKARRASKASLGAEIRQSSQLVELLSSIRVVKAYNLEQEQISRFRNLSRQLVHHGMKGVQAKELVNPAIEIISMIGVGGLLVYIFTAQTTVADFVGFITALMLLFLSIKKLAAVHILFETASPGVHRLVEILGEKPTVPEPASPRPWTQFQTVLSLENVTFAYRDRPVIRDLTLQLPRGVRLGVAGPSGSGKSTLVNLLFRFYDPSAGTIKVDGIDLRDISSNDLRKQLALVSQEVVLFDQTVAENIACGRPGTTRAEVEQAARDAYAHDFIVQLPQGYDTRVGERGVTLSGGQRQRIAIARAFIRNAPILVLDEATAALDSEAEGEVQRAIDHLSENRTVLTVAHRLATLANTHEIVVLEEGRIVERGAFGELIERGGVFAGMARRQGILKR